MSFFGKFEFPKKKPKPPKARWDKLLSDSDKEAKSLLFWAIMLIIFIIVLLLWSS